MLSIGMLRKVHLCVAMWLVCWGVVGCGDPTDSPEDCTSNEFFNEAEELCQTCAAVVAPDCRPGCGFVLIQDANKCPIAQCDTTCQQCPAGESWSSEQLSCQPITCQLGQYYDAASGGCLACPASSDDCRQSCTCSTIEQSTDARGCPQTTCSDCTEAEAPYQIDQGVCVLVNQ